MSASLSDQQPCSGVLPMKLGCPASSGQNHECLALLPRQEPPFSKVCVQVPWDVWDFPRDMRRLFLIWKGLQFWKNLRICVFVCFLESNTIFLFFFFFLGAVLVHFAIAQHRILPLYPGCV